MEGQISEFTIFYAYKGLGAVIAYFFILYAFAQVSQLHQPFLKLVINVLNLSVRYHPLAKLGMLES